MNGTSKIKPDHLRRKALVYLRQSSERQTRENLESQRLQYGMADRARDLGWVNVVVVDIEGFAKTDGGRNKSESRTR